MGYTGEDKDEGIDEEPEDTRRAPPRTIFGGARLHWTAAMVIRHAILLVALEILGGLGAEEPPKDVVQVAPPAGATRVPDVLRQGTFLAPQAVSAVEVSADERSIAVSTLAFRHDRNFWLLSADGKTLRGRHVAPWAPFQVAASLNEPKTLGSGDGVIPPRRSDLSVATLSCSEA